MKYNISYNYAFDSFSLFAVFNPNITIILAPLFIQDYSALKQMWKRDICIKVRRLTSHTVGRERR